MNIDDIYSGRYLKAANLPVMAPGQGLTVTITATELVEFDDGKKQIGLHLAEFPDKVLGLNKTNIENVRVVLGDEWEHGWVGKHIELRREKVAFQGKPQDAIRAYPVHVEPQAMARQPVGETSIAPQSMEQGLHDHMTGRD